MARAIMIQGTGSSVGKSLLVAGLCRAFASKGLAVRPFKPQNMSNNAAAATDEGEIGRAQALQALACRVDPVTDMNPVLLKPESEQRAQIILNGKRLHSVRAREYREFRRRLLPPVLASLRRLAAEADLVIVEGAGSPAEINLRRNDIANMGFALASGIPVILVGDIDRGGVIAQIAGTKLVLDGCDAAAVKGFVVNKFRGDKTLFDDGYKQIESLTGWRGIGIVPWFEEAESLPSEDALEIKSGGDGPFKVVCPVLPRIANFDDLDPLRLEPGISLKMLRAGTPIPGDAGLIVLPGSKSTRSDLAFLKTQGWDIDIRAHARRGGYVLGVCGGYQMLGREISDPEGIEGAPGTDSGLALLNAETVMAPEKKVGRVRAKWAETSAPIAAYEIHIGRTTGPDCNRPFAFVETPGGDRLDGAISVDGRVAGTYLHGLFESDKFRRQFLSKIGTKESNLDFSARIDSVLDALAAHVANHVDMEGLLKISRKVGI
ncbi:MAG: cobyric acid synthase [Albidovulum sp.]|nr:cobyric acid synthase [Albidovulum sp.]